MPVPICPRKDSEQRLILRGIKCQTAPSSHVRKINSRLAILIILPSQYEIKSFEGDQIFLTGSAFISTVFLVSSETTYWDLRFLFPPRLFFLGWLHPQMTFQACQITANFTTHWALSVTLYYMNILMRDSRLDMIAHMTFKTSKWETEFSTYFTVDVVTL